MKFLERLEPREKEPVNINLSNKSQDIVRDIVFEPNPKLSEIPFLGTKEGQNIEIRVSKKYNRDSQLKQSDESFVSSVDKKELADLFKSVSSENLLNQVVLLGHLHPSGEAIIKSKRYEVRPSTGSDFIPIFDKIIL